MTWWKRWANSEHLVLGLALACFAALVPFTPGITSAENLANLALTLLPLYVVAMGQTAVMITGGIDLSVTSTMALTSVLGAAIMSGDQGWLAGHPLALPVALAGMVALGALVGLLHGAAVVLLRMPAFIVTLTGMIFFSGLAIWLTNSRNIGSLPPAFNAIGGQAWLALLVVAPLALAMHLALRQTVWGRWLFACGQNPRAARVSGVPVGGVVVSAYVLSGLLAGVASILYTGQAESGSPVLGQRLLLDIVGATVLGGTSLFGGRGSVLWTFYGVLFFKLLDNGLNLLGLSHYNIMFIKGAVILAAAAADAVRRRIAA
ncbi:MAG: ABC transporter permease [Verrucomicrobiae bacterium]|nr:ABC transporter permease [Verrucomicrobiae bacterium]